MSIAAIVTRGFGSYSRANAVTRKGFAASVLLPEPPAAGKQYKTVASIHASSPLAATTATVGGAWIVDLVTDGGFDVELFSNGLFAIDYAGTARQIFVHNFCNFSPSGLIGEEEIVDGNKPPNFGGSLVFTLPYGFSVGVPITPVDFGALVTDPEGDTMVVTLLDAIPGLSIAANQLVGTPLIAQAPSGNTVRWTDQYGDYYDEDAIISIPDTIGDVFTADVVRPVYVGFFDIKDDPVRGWTGPGFFAPTSTGDSDLDGETFDSANGLIQVSDFVDNDGIGDALTLTFAVSEDVGGFIIGDGRVGEDFIGDPGGPIYDQLIQDRRKFVGRRAKVWLFFMTENEASVLPEYEVVFNGVMTSAAMNRKSGSPSTVSLVCDQDTQKAHTAPARLIDHQNFNPGDVATSFVNDLARGSSAGATNGSSPILPPLWGYDNWGLP